MSYFNFFKAHDQFIPRHFGFRGGGGFMPPRGGNVSITENINIQQGPSGFWGFMAGLGQGLFGGGMGCGMGMGSIFGGMPMMGMGMGMPMMGYGMSPYAMLNGTVTPQGAQQPQQSNNNKLTQLRNLFKAKDVTIEETSPGKFTATDSKGNVIGTNLPFEEMSEKLSNLNKTDNTTVEVPHSETETDEQKLTKKPREATETPAVPPAETHVKVKPQELKNGVQITVIDEVWDATNPDGDGHITGKTTLSGKVNAEGFDKLIIIGGKHYQLQDNKVNGDPVYRSLNSQKHDTYRLSKKDGKLVLIQSESDKGKLDGVGSADFHPRRHR